MALTKVNGNSFPFPNLKSRKFDYGFFFCFVKRPHSRSCNYRYALLKNNQTALVYGPFGVSLSSQLLPLSVKLYLFFFFFYLKPSNVVVVKPLSLTKNMNI